MRKKYLLTLVLLFFSGAVTGGVVTSSYIGYKFLKTLQEGPKGVNKMIVQFSKTYYDLDDEQTEQMHELVTKYQKIVRSMRKKRFPEDKVISDNFRVDIRKILKTKEQLDKADTADRIFDEKYNDFSDVQDSDNK